MPVVIDRTTIITGDFNVSFPVVDTTTRKEINSDTEDTTTIRQLDTTDSYRAPRPETEGCTWAIQHDKAQATLYKNSQHI